MLLQTVDTQEMENLWKNWFLQSVCCQKEKGKNKIESERVKYWISKGAKPTLRVSRLLGEAQLMPMPKPTNNPLKAIPKKIEKD